MKILMANNYHYLRGGSERVMFEEVAALADLGHEVATFSVPSPGDLPSPRAFRGPEIPDAGGSSLLGKVTRFARLIANPEVRASFLRALDEFRPDVVHFHNIYGRLTPVVAEATRDRRIPSVLTAHDYKLICPSYLRLDEGIPCSACSYGHYGPAFRRRCHKGSRLYSALYGLESIVNVRRGRYDGVFAFLCPSQFMLESLATKGVPRERLRLLRNCFASPPRDPEPEATGYVLYAGRLSPEKGVTCLLRAVAKLEVPLLLAGDGPDAAKLRQWVADRGLTSRIRFLGHRKPDELRRLMKGALFTVVPSECLENAPMAILEAFALGKLVVGADIGGIPELVRPGVTGVLFPPGDAARLRDAMRELLASPAKQAAMGQNARALVQEHQEQFSPREHARRLLHVYGEALA
jgi:glycosyltransferase involved in cell wall biosynthesis